MTSFTDISGREWSFSINLGAAKRALEQLGINILNPTGLIVLTDAGEVDRDKSLVMLLSENDVFVGDLVAAFLTPVLRERNVSKESFLETIGGKNVRELRTALFDELNHFFSDSGNAPAAEMMKNFIDEVVNASAGTPKENAIPSAGETL